MQWSIVFIVLSIVHICTINGQCSSPDINFCNFINCGNGTCIDDAAVQQCFRCRCPADYTGPYCETQIVSPSPCGAPCQNDGQCQLTANNVYACNCPADFTGRQCETSVSALNVCTLAPQTACKNGGTCIVAGQGFLCQCAYGWTGASCETQDPNVPCPGDFCLAGGICQLNGNVISCQCPPTHTGARCEIPISITSSVIPPITITPPITTASPITIEPPTTRSVSCTPNPCLNGGTCYNLGNSIVCGCPPTHVGSTCEISLSSSTTPEIITATTITITTATPITITTASSAGPSINCTSRPCLNGASCFNNGNSFFCLCKEGYTGQTCSSQIGPTTIIPPTAPTTSACASNPCNNGGTCYKYGSSFICVCTTYYTGDTCSTVKTFTTPAVTTPGLTITCANRPCQNGGTCYSTGNTYFCFCGSTSMYTGKNCETSTATIDPNCPLDCSPGYCIRTGNNNNAYACICNGVLTPTSCRS